jgi:hypothetical protein
MKTLVFNINNLDRDKYPRQFKTISIKEAVQQIKEYAKQPKQTKETNKPKAK